MEPRLETDRDVLAFLDSWGCGCAGTENEQALFGLLRFLRDNLARPFEEADSFGDWAEEMLPPEPWTYLPLFWLESKGLIEHGVAIRVPWLTPQGDRVLAFLDKYGDDPDEWEGKVG